MKRHRGFTIVELLVVIAIIMVLAGLILPTFGYARRKAKVTSCMNNLNQIHKALLIYQQDYIGQGGWDYFPSKLTYLNRDGYSRGGEEMYLCPLDDTKGTEGGKPPGVVKQFAELDEGGGPGEVPLSYMYEFSGVACSWSWQGWITWPATVTDPVAHVDRDGNGEASWGEVKQAQLKYGDDWWNDQRLGGPAANPTGYPPSGFPILRCFWHMDDADDQGEERVMNLAYSGNVFKSVPQWEYSIE